MKKNIDKYPYNAIKSFLRIETPKIRDTPFYEINNNLITLYNPFYKKPSDRQSTFELDKIFTDKDENSYIYEEICLNTIKDCLQGFSYSFISYGETSSKKIDTLIGNIEDSVSNINHRGIYPRLLEGLMKNINNEENNENKYSLLMSFFLVYSNKLIDLSALKGMENNNINIKNLFSKSFIIKNETNIINKISKIKVEKLEKHLLFINKILSSLSQIEKDTKENILSSSHICLVLYLNNMQNNEITKISNISFILLNGSEYLYSSEIKKLTTQELNNNIVKKNVVEGAKINLETQFIYETVYNCIKSVKCIEININRKSKFNTKENLLFSNLTTAIYNICFSDDIQKIKFRIIGTIYPNTGLYQSVKDTILFLYDCKNIIKRKKEKIQSFENSYDSSVEIKEKRKDDYIFQLENKVKDLKNKIEKLGKHIDKKDEKITFLQDTYIEQINTLKKRLNFPGDINVLIAGDEYTKEANFVREMRDYQENIKRNEGNIHILERKLKEANDEIIKLKNKNIVKSNDETMVNYYLSSKLLEEKKSKKNSSFKVLYQQIDELKNEIKAKGQINNELMKEIKKKDDILFNLPLALKEKYSLNKELINIKKDESLIRSNKISEIKNEKSSEKKEETENDENSDMDSYYKEQIKKINEENKKNIQVIELKYKNILEEKNKELDNIKLLIKKKDEQNKKEVILWKKELIKYNEKFMQLLTNYKRIFFSKIPPQYSIVTVQNKKEEFDKILSDIEKEINQYNFPKLFQELELNNNLGITHTGSMANMLKTIPKKIKKEKLTNENDKKSEDNSNNLKMNIPPISLEKIKNTVEEIFEDKNKIIKNKKDLETMSKEGIVLYCLKLNKKVEEIEYFLEKYTQYRKGFNIEQFENNINYKENVIKELNEKMNKLKNSLEEHVKINYNNMNVISTQNRIIEKLQKEKLIKNILNKNKNNSITFLRNENSKHSSIFHSIYKNNNNANNMNLGEKIIKKSNSCLDLSEYNDKKRLISNRHYNFKLASRENNNENFKKNNLNRTVRPISSITQYKEKNFFK